MSQTAVRYALAREVGLTFEEADRRVREALQSEGFGVLTEIDVQATLKKKLQVEFPPYRILGACNPPLARQALETEADIGLLLPCNVVVRVLGDTGRVVVEALDPVLQLEVSGNEELVRLGQEARARLVRVLERVESG
ncbi:MAG: DUF302 domain-containing protein [Gemmatimonadetes bacterium]|nr:DUF302 domain-containing protein [Gemmatimonadota bacterium]